MSEKITTRVLGFDSVAPMPPGESVVVKAVVEKIAFHPDRFVVPEHIAKDFVILNIQNLTPSGFNASASMKDLGATTSRFATGRTLAEDSLDASLFLPDASHWVLNLGIGEIGNEFVFHVRNKGKTSTRFVALLVGPVVR